MIRSAFIGSGCLAVGFIDPDFWASLVTAGAIIAGWVWIESRNRRHVKDALDSHTAVEEEWRRAVEEKLGKVESKLDRIFDVIPKRKED